MTLESRFNKKNSVSNTEFCPISNIFRYRIVTNYLVCVAIFFLNKAKPIGSEIKPEKNGLVSRFVMWIS